MMSCTDEPHLFWFSPRAHAAPANIQAHGAVALSSPCELDNTEPAVVFLDCREADAANELAKMRAETGPKPYLIPVVRQLTAQRVVSLVVHGANDAVTERDIEQPEGIIRDAKGHAGLIGLALGTQAGLAQIQAHANAMGSPVFMKDADGIYIGCNDRFENFLGFGREAIQGKTVYDVAPSELALTYHRADLDLVSSGGLQSYATGVRHASGKICMVRFFKSAIRDSAGRIAGIVGAMHDIADVRGLRDTHAEFQSVAREINAELGGAHGAAPAVDPDAPVVERIAQRNAAALAQLYRTYHRRLTRFLNRMSWNEQLIEEVINDTFMVVWNKAAQFRYDCAASTWIMSIAYRCALSALRRERHTRLLVPLDDSYALMHYWHDYESSDLISKALNLLPDEQRLVMSLAYVLGHSMTEIADIIDRPPATVKAILHRARNSLRRAMSTLGH
jgi:RNA polymerase sigma factor (sigma-70 family)